MEDISNYEALRDDTQKFYNNARPVMSPALNERPLKVATVIAVCPLQADPPVNVPADCAT